MMPLLTIKPMKGFLVQRVRTPLKVFPCRPSGQYLIWSKKALKYLTNSYAAPFGVTCNWSSRRTEKSNLFVKSKTNLIKKRTRHRNTCQAFPCDNQYRAVDTTLSWSAWGMVRLLTIARKKTNDYISATEYMQFSIRQISIKDALVDCHFSSYKLNKAILQKWLIEWRSDI